VEDQVSCSQCAFIEANGQKPCEFTHLYEVFNCFFMFQKSLFFTNSAELDTVVNCTYFLIFQYLEGVLYVKLYQ